MASSIYYVYLVWVRVIVPVMATWILMGLMMGLSFWIYWNSPDKSWSGNVGITGGIFNVGVILVGIIAFNVKNRQSIIALSGIQLFCILLGVLVAILWLLTEKGLLSYGLVQLIALIAYVATAARLWRATKSTEPISFWAMILLGNFFAIYPGWVKFQTKGELFGFIYLARAIPCTILIIYLIWRIRGRTERMIS